MGLPPLTSLFPLSVKHGLRRTCHIDSVFVSDLLREAKANELDEPLSTTRLNHLIDKGYAAVLFNKCLYGVYVAKLDNVFKIVNT